MPIPFRDEISFLFNNGRGLRTDQLNGEFVKTVIVEGDTLVVTKQMADGSEEQVRAEGVMGVPTFLRRAGTSVDATFTAAEMIAGTTSMNESIVTPPQVAGTVDQQYLGFWLPDTADELTNITYVETTSINRRYQWFGQPVALAVDGADGYVYPSVASFNLPVLGDQEWALRSETGLPVFIRRCAAHTRADKAFTVADFTTGTNSTSLDRRITTPTLTGTSWIAFALPTSTPDATEISDSSGGVLSVNYVNLVTLQPGGLTIAGVDYNVWVSDTQYFANALSNVEFTIIQ